MASVVSLEDCVMSHVVCVASAVATFSIHVGSSRPTATVECCVSVAEYQSKQEDTSTQVLWALLLPGKRKK